MDNFHFRRDSATGALISTDSAALQEYKERRERFEKIEDSLHRFQKIEDDINRLNDSLQCILTLLQTQNRG